MWLNLHYLSPQTPGGSIIDLLSGLRNGDREAYRILVSTYEKKVFQTAHALVQDYATAEDITQEVFVTVFRGVATFHGRSSLSTWIYRITVNKCLDHIKTNKRQKRQGIMVALFSKNTGEPLAEAQHTDHPAALMEQREKAEYLKKAIACLPPNQQTVFVLAHVEELPQKEIAEIMAMSLKAVESLLQRAKGNLRKELADMYERRNK